MSNLKTAEQTFKTETSELEEASLMETTQDEENKRRTLEGQVGEMQSRFNDGEKQKAELGERCSDITVELESVRHLLNEADGKNMELSKDVATLEETHQKLQFSTKLQQADSDKNSLQKKLEEEMKDKRNEERHVSTINIQLSDTKKKLDEIVGDIELLEQGKKHLQIDLKAANTQPEKKASASDKLEETKNLELRVEELQVNLIDQRQSQSNLEKKQKKLDQVHELEMSKRGLEARVEELGNELQAAENAKECLVDNMQAQFERDPHGQNEMAEKKKRQLVKQVRELEADLEDERRRMARVAAAKEKLETSMKDLEGQKQMANRGKDKAVKLCHELRAQMKDSQRNLEVACAAREDVLLTAAKETEKKAKRQEAELMHLQQELAAAERARQQAEAGRNELSDKLANNSSEKSAWTNVKRQLVAMISQLREELDEKREDIKTLNCTLRKSRQQVDQQNKELQNERSTSEENERARQQMELQNEELKAKLQKMENHVHSKFKSSISALEANVAQLEEQLEQENREKQETAATLCRMNKKLKDLMMQVEGERKQAEQYKDQLEKANTDVKQLKRQLEESAEEYHRANRKLKRELDDANEDKDAMSCEVNSIKSKLRHGHEPYFGSTALLMGRGQRVVKVKEADTQCDISGTKSAE